MKRIGFEYLLGFLYIKYCIWCIDQEFFIFGGTEAGLNSVTVFGVGQGSETEVMPP